MRQHPLPNINHSFLVDLTGLGPGQARSRVEPRIP